MHKNRILILVTIASLLSMTSRAAYAQSPDADGRRFEVGGQFSILNNSVISDAGVTSVICVTTPCPSIVNIAKSRKTQPGFGGRFGYNLTDNFALEAELNFFPSADLFSQPEAFNGGNLIEGLFGLKAGKRFEKIGVFGKARPGFLYASKGDLRPKTGGCVTIFPPPAGCFETTSKNSLAFDFGGVLELYPTKRMLIRFDVGDTIVRLGARNVSGILTAPGSPPNFPVVVAVPAETTHNLQVSAGIGFRF
jgi:Outer membrane protein beta-barrel domain